MIKICFHALGRFILTIVFGISPVRQIEDQQCIIVANHNTHIDILILLRLFPLGRVNKVKVIAAKDYFSKGLAGFFGQLVFNLILVDRSSRKVDTALAPLRQALADGYSMIIFPEGTRGDPGVLERFKTGVGQLSVDYPKLPVYPVFLKGVEKTLPRGRFLPIPFNISIQISEPLYGKDYITNQSSSGRKKLTAKLEERIFEMKNGVVL